MRRAERGDPLFRSRLVIGGEFAPPPLDPAGLPTGAIAQSRRETARVFCAAAPDVVHLFRAGAPVLVA